jgi:glycosyltransferase involved in cell wall biosynthesis
MAGRLDRLHSWLLRSSGLPFEIILVHDFQDQQTQNELESMVGTMTDLNLKFLQGNWNSPGLARNFGLQYATKSNVVFWDSDDLPNLDEVHQALIEASEEFDMLIGNFEVSNLEQAVVKYETSNDLTLVALNPGLWRIIINRNFLGASSFNSLRMAEDQIFLCELLSKSPRISYSPRIFYRYFKGSPQQLTNDSSALADLLKVSAELKEIPLDLNQSLRNALQIMYLKLSLSLITRYPLSGTKHLLRNLRKIRVSTNYTFSKDLCKALIVFFRNPNMGKRQ